MDEQFLITFLKDKVKKLENNSLSDKDFKLLRNYFLDSQLSKINDDEIKKCLFIGYFINNFINKDKCFHTPD